MAGSMNQNTQLALRVVIVMLTLTALGLGLSLLFTATSHADTPEEQFLNDLTIYGFHVDGNESGLVKVGRSVCQSESTGTTHTEAVQEMYDAMPEGTLTMHEAGNFVSAAEDALCVETAA
jgi:hypothetical protein